MSLHFDPAAFAAAPMRWATFTAIVTVLGAIGFQFAVLRPALLAGDPASSAAALAARRATLLAAAAALLLLPLAGWRLAAQVGSLTDPGQPAGPVALALLRRTVWGRGWWLQVAGAWCAAVAFAPAAKAGRATWVARCLGAGLLALSPAFSGHAAGTHSYRMLSITTDWLHVVAAGGWLGTMAMLVSLGLPQAVRLPDGLRARTAATMIRSFSPLALCSAVVVAVTGGVAVLLRLSAVSQLWTSGYGLLLLLKLLLVGSMVALGAWNWKRMTPRLHQEGGLRAARRTIASEVAVGMVLLLVTAVLVATPYPAQ